VERKHGVARQVFQEIDNTDTWEKSVLARVVNHQLHTLQSPGCLRNGLIPPIRNVETLAVQLGTAQASVALRCSTRNAPAATGDLVKVGKSIGLIVSCVDADGVLGLLMDEHSIASEDPTAEFGNQLARSIVGTGAGGGGKGRGRRKSIRSFF